MNEITQVNDQASFHSERAYNYGLESIYNVCGLIVTPGYLQHLLAGLIDIEKSKKKHVLFLAL